MAYIGRKGGHTCAVLVDNPAGIDVFMATATAHMENQSFLGTDHLFGSPTLDITIRTGGFPVANISFPL